MTATQEHLLKLLLEIDEICKKNDIEYFLAYGTILGAVRHEGFIPWDNDLDITMTEENYDRFVQACSRELDHCTRTFCDNRRNREYPVVFGHYIDMECCRMTKKTNFWSNMCGQCIDIFCMIELPGKPEEKQKMIDLYYAYDEYVNRSFRHYLMKTDKVYGLYQKFKEEEKKIGYDAVCRKLESQIFGKHYEDCDTYMMCSARAGNPTPFVPKSAYDESREVKYEGHTFKVPADYVDILTLYYGDDFHLFPPNLRIHSEMSHTGIPSQVYVDDFMRLIDDRQEFLDERRHCKDAYMEEAWYTTKLYQRFYEALGYKVARSLKKIIQEKKLDVEGMIKKGANEDLKRLYSLFETYFEKQLHSSVRYWRVYFPIDDELAYAAMYVQFHYVQSFTNVERLLLLRRQNNLEITEKMQELHDAVRSIRDIKKYMLYGEYEKAGKALGRALDHFPNHKEVRLWELRYRVLHAEKPEEYEQCNELADELLALYPGNAVCLKAKGDICFAAEGLKGAGKYYNDLKENCNDGLILLDIHKKEGGCCD